MSKSKHQDDLDLLLSLQDRVLETPPASPSSHSPDLNGGYLSDDGLPNRMGQGDMSVFRDAVQDCLDYDPESAMKSLKSKQDKRPNDAEFEKFSGLRIRNLLVSPIELSNRLSDIKFVRLPALKNSLIGDTLSGCWATIGVLTDKGQPRTSSAGKTFAIWRMGCLDEKTISVFLFGDAYQKNCDEKAGTVFALFNCNVRKDNSENGFSLSVYSAMHILKMGTSVDYGICKGKRKDGMACTLVINKRQGIYCSYHKLKKSEQYSVTRTELKGGNLRTAFIDRRKSQGIYVNTASDRTNLPKSSKAPVKLLSVEGLRKALSNASKVTTNVHSQGIRFLTEVTEKTGSKPRKEASNVPPQPTSKTDSRSLRKDMHRSRPSEQPDSKKIKLDQRQAPVEKGKHVGKKMIELDLFSSDDEL